MRLISTRDWGMRDFTSDDDVPSYAILSHTWGEEEVSYQQWECTSHQEIEQWKGYVKIRQFGERAASDGFDWVWVDTYAAPPPG